MSIVQQLRDVQEHDCRIRDLEREARDIPARKEQELSRLNEHRRQLEEAQEGLKQSQVALQELELEGRAYEEKIVKLRRQQMEIKTNREFKAMENEIAGVQSQISGLEDRELELMEILEQKRADVVEGKEALADEDALVQKDIVELDQRLAGIAAELERARAVREEAAAHITDAALLTKYNGLMRTRDRALVALDGLVCTGCHMHLPPSVGHDIQREGQIVTCSYCARILYRA